MTQERPSGLSIDTTTPNTARIWDCQLGGKDNFAVDRQAMTRLNDACKEVGAPDGRDVARVNRAFLQRAVRYLAGPAGVDQFVDLGAGLPTRGNVHEVARGVNPNARTVYVDYDPMVLAHARGLLADTKETTVIQADVRDPDAILASTELREHLDLSRPVAVLFVAVLHLLTDDEDPWRVVARIRDALAPGSYAVITHVTGDSHPEAANAVAALFRSLGVSTPLVPRPRSQICALFDGFDLVEPGLVLAEDWRPDREDPDPRLDIGWFYAGVGRLPAAAADVLPSAEAGRR